MSPELKATLATVIITLAAISLGYWLGWRHGSKSVAGKAAAATDAK